MRDASDRPLYVGAAGDLRQPHAVVLPGRRHAAPGRAGAARRRAARVPRGRLAVRGAARRDRPDRRRSGPGANRQGTRPDRLAYLRLEREGLPRLVVTDTIGVDGAHYAGPVGRRAAADDVARALRLAFGLRSCRAARPVEEGCLEGRLGRCVAPCRGAARAGRARRCGGGAGRRAGGRQRADRPVAAAPRHAGRGAPVRGGGAAARRGGGAARRRDRSCGGCAARAPLHGVVLARAPRSAPGGGVRRRLRARGRAAAAAAGRRRVARGVRAGRRASTARWPSAPAPRAPTPSPAERRDEALHVAAAFARPASAHVAVAGTGAALATAVARRANPRLNPRIRRLH